MKNYLISLVCLVCSLSVKSQHCSEVLKTTASTINIWDWRSQYWAVNASTNGGPGVLTSVLSPFYNVDNINLSGIATTVYKDYKPEDGWELLKKNLGNAGETPVTNAYVVFYNKYTAKIRVFFLVTQTFSNTGSNGSSNALIKIYFDKNNSYQSNLLTTFNTPLLPLDQFKRDANINTPNIFFNQLPYWLISEFPVAYDPCTCGKAGVIRIELTLLQGANIEFDLNSVPYQKTVDNGQIDTNKDWLTSFTQFSGKVEGGLNATKSTQQALGKLNDAIAKQTNVNLQNELTKSLGKVNNIFNSVGNLAALVPVAGAAVQSVVSLIDYFSGGATSSPAGPSPVMIMNNFKGKGSITSEVFKNEIALSIPGSDQTSADPAIKPVYNNTLGSFNLLRTPGVLRKVYTFRNPWRSISTEYFYLTENLKYVINPALNIDLSKSSIRAAFIFENCSIPTVFTNMQQDVEGAFRSSYYPLGSLNEAIPWINSDIRCSNSRLYIKIIARLHPAIATSDSQDIIFIAKYPVNISTQYINGNINPTVFSSGLEELAEDVVFPDNTTLYTQIESYEALNTINLGSSSVFGDGNGVKLIAGESITLRPGAVITPAYALKVGGVYSSLAPPLQSLKATSSELINFCGSSDYNGVSNQRNTPTAREQTTPKDLKVLTRDEFFTFYPNPATNQVTFNYFLEEPTSVALGITDISGRSVAAIVNREQEMGDYSLTYDTSSLSPGVYIVSFQTNKITKTEKLVVIK